MTDPKVQVRRTDWESADGHDLVGEITRAVRAADRVFEKEGGSSRHWVRDYFIPHLEAIGLTIAPLPPVRLVTTPHDDPIVQTCIDHGGHYWPENTREDEPSTCTRCWFNPGWAAGKPATEAELRVVKDVPQA